MKVLSKVIGAILLLGCLAYISFVFGKYVLSSTLLKSIPQSQRIINTDAPAPQTQNVPPPKGSPRVQMRVMPPAPHLRETRNTRSSAEDSSDDDEADRRNSRKKDDDKTTDSDDSDKPKSFDDVYTAPSEQRKKRRRKRTHTTETSEEKKPQKKAASPPPKPKAQPSDSAPIRHMTQTETQINKSPVPTPEKSTSTPSSSGDAGNISPIPKPE